MSARTRGYTGTMRDWDVTGRPLTEDQQKLKTRPNSVRYIKRAELDGTLFTSVEWSDGKLTDNSYIVNSYKEEEDKKEVTVTSIGHIKYMFVASLRNGGPEDVVIGGDWYDVVGTNTVSKNKQVRYNPNFASEHLAFLRNCTPINLILVPSDPFEPDGPDRLYDILDD